MDRSLSESGIGRELKLLLAPPDPQATTAALTAEERARLRALGYLE